MTSLIEFLAAPLRETFFQKALIGGSLVAVVCGVAGCLVLLRRMAFLGDALSHAMIAGVAGGYLFMKVLFGVEAYAPAMLLGSLLSAVVTVALISLVARVSRIKEDAAIGIMYTGVFAAGVVLVSVFRQYIHIDLMHFIMGDVLGVADADLWAAAVVAALVLSVIVLFFRHLQLTTFDPVMAASIGMPVLLLDYVLTSCVSLVVVSAVSMVGVILVVGLLITPAATAYLLSDRLQRMMGLAALFGVTSVAGGLYLCVALDSSGGGAIMLFCALQFIVVLVVAPRYGLLARWLRLRRMAPQELVEDLLIELLRCDGAAAREALLTRLREPGKARRALSTLSAQGLLTQEGSGVRLTEAGTAEALRLRRAHRLWETYLDHVGTPSEEIHPRAQTLEHVRDSHTLAQLDELLGHPTRDPHGQAIPEDVDAAAPERETALSVLHEGRLFHVAGVPASLAAMGLQEGERFRVAAREDEGATWVIVRDNGQAVRLDHAAADALRVRGV